MNDFFFHVVILLLQTACLALYEIHHETCTTSQLTLQGHWQATAVRMDTVSTENTLWCPAIWGSGNATGQNV